MAEEKRPRGRPRKDGLPAGSVPKPKPSKATAGRKGRKGFMYDKETSEEVNTAWNTEQAAAAAMARKLDLIDRVEWDHENNRPYKDGIGRPKGSKNVKIDPYNAAGKLEELNFDPIKEMIELYKQINRDLKAVRVKSDEKSVNMPTDDPRRYEFVIKRGTHQYNGLLQIKQNIIKDLQRYGYRMVPDKQEVEMTSVTPTMIKLDLGGPDEQVANEDEGPDVKET